MSLPLLSDRELANVKEKYSYDGKCPTCLGKGFYPLDGQEYNCDCADQIRLTKTYYNANIDRRYHVLDFDDFQSSDRDRIIPYMQEYLKNFDSSLRYGMGWNLGGNLATGKTLILCSTLKTLLKAGYRCYFIQGQDILDISIASNRSSEDRVLLEQKLRRVQVLGIDELQKPQSDAHNAVIASTLEGVIRYRHNNSLPTLLTTNLTDTEQVDYYPRVFSLLSGVNEWLQMGEKSDYRASEYRKRLKELRANREVLPVL